MNIYPIILSENIFLHRDKLLFPYEERGQQFGDGVYEVIRIYDGRFYLLNEHIDRLYRSLEAIKIKFTYTKEELIQSLHELLFKNSMHEDGIVYLQVTRGSAARDHAFPTQTKPNFYAYVKKMDRKLAALEQGVQTISTSDVRWKYCYIKTLNLLPNVLAKQEAVEQDCYEAILFEENGFVTEGSSTNIYLVKDGKVYTHPATPRILKGCVRMAVEKFTDQLHIPFIEEAFSISDIEQADEMFLTSSTSEVTPIVKVDDTIIKQGKPGPVTRKLQQAYEEHAQIHERREPLVTE